MGIFFVAYLFSKNRKAIPWKTVFIGLSIQILLAYSILEISWVQWVFEKIGQVFVSILNFTDAGSEFLFGNLMESDKYGFIFVFKILPTIIFFAALTSLLFYFGVLQFFVKILAKLTTTILKISLAAIFVLKYVPETKGKTLEEMNKLWKK